MMRPIVKAVGLICITRSRRQPDKDLDKKYNELTNDVTNFTEELEKEAKEQSE